MSATSTIYECLGTNSSIPSIRQKPHTKQDIIIAIVVQKDYSTCNKNGIRRGKD
jgi:hypothetical protein